MVNIKYVICNYENITYVSVYQPRLHIDEPHLSTTRLYMFCGWSSISQNGEETRWLLRKLLELGG